MQDLIIGVGTEWNKIHCKFMEGAEERSVRGLCRFGSFIDSGEVNAVFDIV